MASCPWCDGPVEREDDFCAKCCASLCVSELTTLPRIALSVRQPWAWAIFNGKDVENRSQLAITKGNMRRARVAIHASKGLTREEYDYGRDFMRELGVVCPPAAELERGGIIGSVDVVAIVSSSASRWFFGPRGLVLRDAVRCAFIPASGELGYFRWKPADPSIVPPPAKWMKAGPSPEDLFS
jgi:hypothetical protein